MRKNRTDVLLVAEKSFQPLERNVEGMLIGGFSEIISPMGDNYGICNENCPCPAPTTTTTTTTTTQTTKIPPILNFYCG